MKDLSQQESADNIPVDQADAKIFRAQQRLQVLQFERDWLLEQMEKSGRSHAQFPARLRRLVLYFLELFPVDHGDEQKMIDEKDLAEFLSGRSCRRAQNANDMKDYARQNTMRMADALRCMDDGVHARTQTIRYRCASSGEKFLEQGGSGGREDRMLVIHGDLHLGS